MTAATNLTGLRFGRLVAIERAGSRSGNALWRFKCDCGADAVTTQWLVKSGKTLSCGCLKNERIRRHGYSKKRIYKVWSNMRSRCDNPKTRLYFNYGGRGIRYDPSWRNPAVFLEWALANGYQDDLEIDRIDNSGDYTPENCRFVSHAENMRNRRNSRIIEFEGQRMTISDLGRHTGIHVNTLRARTKRGMSVAEAVKAGAPLCGLKPSQPLL